MIREKSPACPAFKPLLMWSHPVVTARLIAALCTPCVLTAPDCALFSENAIYLLVFHSFPYAIFLVKNYVCFQRDFPICPSSSALSLSLCFLSARPLHCPKVSLSGNSSLDIPSVCGCSILALAHTAPGCSVLHPLWSLVYLSIQSVSLPSSLTW